MGENFSQGVSPTFVNLKDQLATMYGAAAASDLQPVDEQRVGIYVNQAYRECYAPVNGRRPAWAKTHFGLSFPAPFDTTLSVVNGSNAVGFNDVLPEGYEGSFVKIGTEWFTISYIAVGGATGELVTPWDNDTDATIAATVYYSSHRMDREIIDVDMVPELVGEGPLSPLSGPEIAIRIRSRYSHDFIPGRAWGNLPKVQSHGDDIELGRPSFYFVDVSALRSPSTGTDAPTGLQNMEEMAVRPRFNLYPLPDKEYLVKGTANILPHELTEAGDQARLPGNIVWDILYPIACAKLALVDPRYNGDNKEAIQRVAEEARGRLQTFTNVQKHKNLRITRRAGY